jgi:broad specificity phosphatase PhoE
MNRIVLAAAMALLCLLPFAVTATATEAGWALLREGGQVVLLRHAYTLGTVDQDEFDIEDCSTQRNLSERGKLQARKMGALFAARGAPVERVYSSRLCRALQTANLAFQDSPVEPFPPLDPPEIGADYGADARAAVLALVRGYRGSDNIVLVTDLATIQALTGVSAREGEALIVRAREEMLRIEGRIIFN